MYAIEKNFSCSKKSHWKINFDLPMAANLFYSVFDISDCDSSRQKKNLSRKSSLCSQLFAEKLSPRLSPKLSHLGSEKGGCPRVVPYKTVPLETGRDKSRQKKKPRKRSVFGAFEHFVREIISWRTAVRDVRL